MICKKSYQFIKKMIKVDGKGKTEIYKEVLKLLK